MVKREGKLKPRAVMPVDLFGQTADYRALEPICKREGLKMLCDAAQGFGALLDGRRAGGIGDAASTSFFPAKPLGCYGDGGATFTNDDALAETLRSIRVHGQGSDKYENVRIGVNSRLDTIQAAILLEKLSVFPEEIEMREAVAQRYNDAFRASNRIVCTARDRGRSIDLGAIHDTGSRARQLQSELKAKGIPSAVYYPIPLSAQKGYKHFPSAPTPVSDKICKTVIALPMHPYLDTATQDRIIETVLGAV